MGPDLSEQLGAERASAVERRALPLEAVLRPILQAALRGLLDREVLRLYDFDSVAPPSDTAGCVRLKIWRLMSLAVYGGFLTWVCGDGIGKPAV